MLLHYIFTTRSRHYFSFPLPHLYYYNCNDKAFSEVNRISASKNTKVSILDMSISVETTPFTPSDSEVDFKKAFKANSILFLRTSILLGSYEEVFKEYSSTESLIVRRREITARCSSFSNLQGSNHTGRISGSSLNSFFINLIKVVFPVPQLPNMPTLKCGEELFS